MRFVSILIMGFACLGNAYANQNDVADPMASAVRELQLAFVSNRAEAESVFSEAMNTALAQSLEAANNENDRVTLRYEWARGHFAYLNQYPEQTLDLDYRPSDQFLSFIDALDGTRSDLLDNESYENALIAWRNFYADQIRSADPEHEDGDNIRLSTQLAASARFENDEIQCFLDGQALQAQLEDFEADGIDDEPQAYAQRCPSGLADELLTGFEEQLSERDDQPMVVFKNVSGLDLELAVHLPEIDTEETLRPAMVWFHGGGWYTGSWSWCTMCDWFTERGFVVYSVEYRIRGRHNVNVGDSIADARDAITWVRENAATYNVDPDQVIAAGFSAGGHLALSTASLNAIPMSQKPQAAIGISACVDLSDTGWAVLQAGSLEAARNWSPLHAEPAGFSPMLIMNGGRDHLCLFDGVSRFVESANTAGQDVTLIDWPNAGHFSIFRDPDMREEGLIGLDQFLAQQGFETD